MQAALAGVLYMNTNVIANRRMRAMRVQWATNEKAMMASNKHFNGAFNAKEMTTVATAMIKRADMVGTSDRSNGNYAPAKIVWATFNGTKYAVVIDSKDIKKGIATIISFYDINPSTEAAKVARFNMKKVVR